MHEQRARLYQKGNPGRPYIDDKDAITEALWLVEHQKAPTLHAAFLLVAAAREPQKTRALERNGYGENICEIVHLSLLVMIPVSRY